MLQSCELQEMNQEGRSKELRPTSTMERLPPEILLDILSRLPTKTILDIKLVCRSWRTMAQDPVFVNSHFARWSEGDTCLILHCDHPAGNQLYAAYFYAHNEEFGTVKKIPVPSLAIDFQILGSCNGLLCLREPLNNGALHVCNPFTSGSIELPPSSQDSDQWTVFGFGFLPTTKEYKVVQITKVIPSRNLSHSILIRHLFKSKSEVHILTLGSPAWRSLGRISYHLIGSSGRVLVNGRLHWVNWPCRYGPGGVLVSFDLADEQFREVPKPDSADLKRHSYDLVVLGGCLSAAFHGNYGQFEIWIMKDYGVQESWTKEFSIGAHVPRGLEENVVDRSFSVSKLYQIRSFVRVLCGLKNGEILLKYKCRALASYNPNSGAFRDIGIRGMPNWFEAVVHVGCFSSSDSLIGI